MSSQPATTPAAVFLSYAREDAEAARRIADALRAFGVEVWFDQHELRGGDAWDQKIRQQIKDCVLFVPIVSATTESRAEGYFRREWKLAAERTADMGKRSAFLVPVVVDATAESGADVPDEFMRVQWTRLPNGVPTPQFVEQVKRLLEARTPSQTVGEKSEIGTSEVRGQKSEVSGKQINRKWAIAAVVTLALAVAGYVILATRNQSTSIRSPKSPAAQSPMNFASAAGLAKVDAKSIAVLPFTSFSLDRENEIFADGMHDDVITALTKIRDLTVIARASVLSYKGGTRNLREIATELGVANILDATVQRSGNRVKLNVTLIDARNATQLWAENYTEEITDVFAVQARIADAITGALKARFSPEEKSLIARRPTQNQEAYDLYLQAQVIRDRTGMGARGTGYPEAIALYERAVAADPKFALAHAKLSSLHGLMYWFNALDPTPERRARAQAALEKAERLAPAAPETHMARGDFEYHCSNDWSRSVHYLQIAERELPNDADLQESMGAALRRQGRLVEAEARFRRATVLNPRSIQAMEGLAQTMLSLRRYRAVEELLAPRLQMLPPATQLPELFARARYAQDENLIPYKRAMADVVATNSARAYSYARRVGDLDAAAKALERSTEQLDFVGVSGGPAAVLRAELAWLRGEKESARRIAADLLAAIENRRWNKRQEASMFGWKALALAYVGRASEAKTLADTAVRLQAERDALLLPGQQLIAAQVALIAGDGETAFTFFRQACSGPGLCPAELRRDPVWVTLRSDRRFEEILKAMKPL